MTKAIQAKVGEDKTVLIEIVDEPQIVNFQPADGRTSAFGKPEDLLARLDGVGEAISGMCTMLFDRMKPGFRQGAPSEITVEFGVLLFSCSGRAWRTSSVTNPKKGKRRKRS